MLLVSFCVLVVSTRTIFFVNSDCLKIFTVFLFHRKDSPGGFHTIIKFINLNFQCEHKPKKILIYSLNIFKRK